MTTFEERKRSARARIDPFDLDGDTRVIWAQSGQRWQQTDERATAPSWSRIEFAIRLTEPETAKVVARRAIEKEQATARVRQQERQSDFHFAALMAIGLVVLALWLWFLVLLPIAWTK